MAGKAHLYAIIALTVLTPGIGQNEDQPYFSLSSSRTFGSNSRPTVSMSAWNVDKLEFRIYHVNDPVKFFEQLDDPHQFGGSVPIPTRKPTLLERFHAWKHDIRTDVRRTLREQFTESPSAHFSMSRSAPQPATKGTQYAEAPVLNPQQLVLTFMQPVHAASRWESETVDVDVKNPGLYLVEAVNKDLRAYTILTVSDIVSITKAAHGTVSAFVADRGTGQPVSGAEIFSISRDNSKSMTETNADGLAEFKPPSAQTSQSGQEIRVLVKRGAHVAVTTIPADTFGPDRDRLSAYIYTDRPVYRPGHTVHFKGILRLRAAMGYEIPSAQSVSVEIQDPDQKAIYQKTLTMTANGTVQGEVVLPAAAALGGYNIMIHSGSGEGSASFDVEEYKKPEYEVRVTPDAPRLLEGDTVHATVDARYYFGEPVPAAKVKYSVYKKRYWFPLWYESDEDLPSNVPEGDNDYLGDNSQILDQEGQLNQDGKLAITFPTTVSDHHFDEIYRIEARVTDEAGREISGNAAVIATYGNFVLNVEPNRYFYEPNVRAQFTIQARDYDNKPVQTKVRVELVLSNWHGNTSTPQPNTATDVTTGPDGSAIAEIQIPSQPGSYRAHVAAPASGGRTVEDYEYIWVAGPGETNWFGGGDQKTVQIVTDKKSYKPGETAKFLFITGKPGTPVLVSVEGNDLRSQKLIRSKTATAEFEVPVTIADEPNLFVTAAFVLNGELYQNTKRVKVPPEDHKLDIKLTTDKPQYLPGQTGTYDLSVTGAGGKPVPHAEISLGVVDEAIYAIRPDFTENILNYFFGHQWNRVNTDSSLTYYFNGEAGRRRMRLAMLHPAARLAQLKPERLVAPKIRKLFPDTAFWDADILTDANGHAQAKVPFPDSLTTWRATARGVTADDKVGSATLKTIVRKNLILRLAVPRFFVQGDEVVISAIVHNYLATEKTARISLDVAGLDVLDGKTTDIQIPSRREVKLDWRVKAQRVRGATITGKALTDQESDALQLDLPINPAGVQLSTSKGGTLANSAAASFNVVYPDKVEPGSRSLVIHVSPSIVGSLFGALDYLTSFPYGCVEQTMSSFLPDIIVQKTVRDLGVKSSIDEAELQEKIHSGLDRLYHFQHEDGGWGWWETDDTHPFMTAYVVAGLIQARDAGVQVNQDAIDKGAAWLQSTAAPDGKLDRDLRAYITWSLSQAGKPDAALVDKLYGEHSRLSPYGLALLGLTLEAAKDKRAAEIAASLQQSARQDEQQAWWPATRDAMLDFSEDVTSEATAYVVKFLSHEKADDPVLPKAALWLMNHRNEGYWWSSTKQTAMVIYGLTDYLKATHELNPNLNVTVYLNDRPVLTKKFDSSSSAVDAEITLNETPSVSASLTPGVSANMLLPGTNQIRISASGEGRTYYSTRAEYYSTQPKLEKTGTVSLNILRDYFRLSPARQGDRIVYDLNPLNGPVSAGDTIAVRLTVTGTEWKYMLVEDPIPAGTEFIEKDQLYELRNKPPWWEYWFTRREMHDNRMAIFQTYFPSGQKEYFYLLKVVNPGAFTVNPARVQPMYQPEFLSTTESRRFEVGK